MDRCRRDLLSLFVFTLFSAMPGMAAAHSYTVGGIRIGHAWALPNPEAGGDGQAFVPMLNDTEVPDRLIAVETGAARRVVILDLVEKVPTPAPDLELWPNRPVAMRPGGRALKLEGLTRPLAKGERIPLTLKFQRAGMITVDAYVEEGPAH